MDAFSNIREGHRLEDCYFYHTIDLPNLGTIEGEWDLRPGIQLYSGNVAFSGKRVLDVGCANGFLSFYIEKRGASVVSFDLSPKEDWDLVPFAKIDNPEEESKVRKEHIRKINNAYRLGHELLNSEAKAVYGSVYSIPETIRAVDISVFGAILLHLRDPFLAMQSALKLTKETAIITDIYCDIGAPLPTLLFLPDSDLGTLRSAITPKNTKPETNLFSRSQVKERTDRQSTSTRPEPSRRAFTRGPPG